MQQALWEVCRLFQNSAVNRYKQMQTKLKMFIEANPDKLEIIFNAWTSSEHVLVLSTQCEYSPTLQKFVLCVTYNEEPPCLNSPKKNTEKKSKD